MGEGELTQTPSESRRRLRHPRPNRLSASGSLQTLVVSFLALGVAIWTTVGA